MFAALGAIYAFTATPEYETSAALRSVPLNDLDALNRSGVYSLSPDEALMRVASALTPMRSALASIRPIRSCKNSLLRPTVRQRTLSRGLTAICR
ncbi:hypothetical protein NWF32_14615 [Pseudomonas qingdaonensis]|nr:hypothetical protein [Pseudomonas qingdaonensis]